MQNNLVNRGLLPFEERTVLLSQSLFLGLEGEII